MPKLDQGPGIALSAVTKMMSSWALFDSRFDHVRRCKDRGDELPSRASLGALRRDVVQQV